MPGGSRKAQPPALDALVRSNPYNAAYPERTEPIPAQKPEHQMPGLVHKNLRIDAHKQAQKQLEE